MAEYSAIPVLLREKEESDMTTQITIRSDRDTDYVFQYKGEDVTLKAGGILSIADGLDEVVLPTCAMKIVKNLIVIKGDVK